MGTGGYWTTEDANPRHVYHDALIALDETRRINNGQPSLWAKLFDQLNLAGGAHVVHVGAGAGYYSAILAEIVGPRGRVTAIEIGPHLAARARDNLVPWPQATVIVGDGFVFRGDQPAMRSSSMLGSVTSPWVGSTRRPLMLVAFLFH